jgi:hypothetical protein
MPKPINYSDPKRRSIVATRRTMIWIEGSHFQGTGCSECAWVFRPSGPPVGDSLSEMMEMYKRWRDKEFVDHGRPPSERTRRPANGWTVFSIIVAALIALAPAKQSGVLASAAVRP